MHSAPVLPPAAEPPAPAARPASPLPAFLTPRPPLRRFGSAWDAVLSGIADGLAERLRPEPLAEAPALVREAHRLVREPPAPAAGPAGRTEPA
ncbi:hypothetical protein M446_0589 [Methylobacterium sp. 4-46]|nr:hypothetical protein M446_0589 [Methylobacterium sp. 4-46]